MHSFLHRGHKLNCKKVSILKSCLKAWELNKKVCKLIQLVNNHYWYMKSEDNIFFHNSLCKLWIFNKQPHARTCLTQPQVNFPEGSRKWKQSCHKNVQCLWQMATSHTVQTITCLADRKCRTAGMYVATQRAVIFLTKEGNMMCDLQANMRINRITAETLECNGAHLSSTLHSLFPLLLFFSLFTSFLSSQRLCRKCTLEFIFESDKRNACHFLFMPSPYGHMKKCTSLIEGFSKRLPLQAHQTLNI